MDTSIIMMLAGPLIAFTAAVALVLPRSEEWYPVEMMSLLAFAVLIGEVLARTGFGAGKCPPCRSDSALGDKMDSHPTRRLLR
jgi:hypothetical protein